MVKEASRTPSISNHGDAPKRVGSTVAADCSDTNKKASRTSKKRRDSSDTNKRVKEASRIPSSSSSSSSTIDIWAVECAKCLKWRKIANQDAFEDIRSKLSDEPFYCDRNPNVSCNDPGDIEYDSTRAWAFDKPNIPKAPAGFTRRMVMRGDFSKIDIYYQAPTGKTLRSNTEVNSYLANKNNKVKDNVDASQFSFTSPKVVDDTAPPSIGSKRKASVTGVNLNGS